MERDAASAGTVKSLLKEGTPRAVMPVPLGIRGRWRVDGVFSGTREDARDIGHRCAAAYRLFSVLMWRDALGWSGPQSSNVAPMAILSLAIRSGRA